VKYEVTVGGKTFEVEVEAATVRLGSRTMETRLVAVPGSPLRRVAVDGVSRTYAMSRSAEGWLVQHGGRTWPVEIVDERTRSLRQMVGTKKPVGAGGAGAVRAPMPGLVLRLEVEEGQTVLAGDGLLVLEAMKMENEIRAERDGRIGKIFVQPGQAVEMGNPLFELE
jgi:pyruvate carboxylase subunit B